MVSVTGFSKALSFYARGKVGHPAGCGFARCGHARCGDAGVLTGVYQKRISSAGTSVVRMRYYRPTNPQTAPQEANRAKFAAAMVAWGGLTPEQKATYNARAKKRNMFGWGLFIREYYSST